MSSFHSLFVLVLAAQAAPVPATVGPEKYLILELGNPNDSIELIHAFSTSEHVQLTPDDRVHTRALDYEPAMKQTSPSAWFPGFDKGVPPESWMELWCSRSPTFIYLSGHYNTEQKLFNDAALQGSQKGRASIRFSTDTRGKKEVVLNQGLKSEKRWPAASLGAECKVVLVVGCSLIGLREDRSELQAFLSSRNGKRPLVLGFHKACPKKGQEHLVRRFAEAIAKKADWSETELIKAWLSAGEHWSEVSDEIRRHIGYVTSEGKAFSLGAQGTAIPIS